MAITHASLRNILSQIFFGDTTDAHLAFIIPKQGNWLNPQESDVNAATFIGYTIRKNSPILMARQYVGTIDDVPLTDDVVSMLAVVDLQFIGVNAEDFALSTMHWDSREDVRTAFLSAEGQLMNNTRKVEPAPYYQDGANSILSFNVTFCVVWASVQTKVETVLDFARLDGTVVTE